MLLLWHLQEFWDFQDTRFKTSRHLVSFVVFLKQLVAAIKFLAGSKKRISSRNSIGLARQAAKFLRDIMFAAV